MQTPKVDHHGKSAVLDVAMAQWDGIQINLVWAEFSFQLKIVKQVELNEISSRFSIYEGLRCLDVVTITVVWVKDEIKGVLLPTIEAQPISIKLNCFNSHLLDKLWVKLWFTEVGSQRFYLDVHKKKFIMHWL